MNQKVTLCNTTVNGANTQLISLAAQMEIERAGNTRRFANTEDLIDKINKRHLREFPALEACLNEIASKKTDKIEMEFFQNNCEKWYISVEAFEK